MGRGTRRDRGVGSWIGPTDGYDPGTDVTPADDAGPAPVVVVTADVDHAQLAAFAGGLDLCTVPPVPDARPVESAVDADLLARARALVIELGRVDAATLEAAPDLELLVVCRGTPSDVDLSACARRGVQVRTTPARNADATADLTLALVIQALRRTGEAERWMRERRWVPDQRYLPYETFRGPQLRGLTLGIIGFGAVGRRVAARARAFGMEVLAQGPHLPTGAPAEGVRATDLDDLLAHSDVVTLHAPGHAGTRGLIGTRELAVMRPGAVLVNTARAALVEEEALVAALRSGHLAAVALDVFWEEPPRHDHPLFDLPGVVMTPHIGGASDDVVRNHTESALAHLEEWLAHRSA